MKNAKLILKILALASIPVTGYLAAKGAERCNDGMHLLYMKKDSADITRKDRFIVRIKSYWPAMISGAVGMGSVCGMDHISGKELAIATAAVAGGKKRFDAYRQATLETIGEEAESDIRQAAARLQLGKAYIDGEETDEILHTFVIENWIEDGHVMKFKAPMASVVSALNEANREMLDWNSGCGYANVSSILANIGGEAASYISPETDKAGWNQAVLAAECDCYWIPFEILKYHKKPGVYQIYSCWYPNENIEEYTEQLEKEGVI